MKRTIYFILVKNIKNISNHANIVSSSFLFITAEYDTGSSSIKESSPQLSSPSSNNQEPPNTSDNNESLSRKESLSSTSVNKQEPPNTPVSLHTDDFSLYLDPAFEIPRANFSFDKHSPFPLQDYRWEDQGVFMLNKYLQGVGEVLNDEFAEIKDLTDYR